MAAVDNFTGSASLTPAASGPANAGVAVTPSDTVDLATVSRAIWVGGAGNLLVTMRDGNDVLISGIPAGTFLPLRASRVKATTTTASLIVAFS